MILIGREGPGAGRNKHMGELSSVLSCMTDANILSVLNPPLNERNRESLVSQSSTTLPPQADWRMTNPIIGQRIPNGVVSNHFSVDTSSIPGAIYIYHVHIYKVDRDGTVKKDDVAATEDSRITTSLLKRLREKHPEFESNKYNNNY